MLLLALNILNIFQSFPIIHLPTTSLDILSPLCLVLGNVILCIAIFLQYTEIIIGLTALLIPIFIYYCFLSINNNVLVIATINFWSTLTSLFIFFLLRKNKQLVLILLVGIIGWILEYLHKHYPGHSLLYCLTLLLGLWVNMTYTVVRYCMKHSTGKNDLQYFLK